MKQYILDLASVHKTLQKPKNFGRKILNAKVSILSRSIVEILKLHSLRSLEITDNVIDKRMLVQALETTTRLESLTACRVKFNVRSRDSKLEPIELELKSFTFNHSDPGLFELIKIPTKSLKSFHCECYHDVSVVQFLTDQPGLKSLALVGSFIAADVVNNIQGASCSFRLEKLTIGGSLPFNVVQPFIELHKATLKELNMDCICTVHSMQSISMNMKKLEVLSVTTSAHNYRGLSHDIKQESIQLENLKQLTIRNLNDMSPWLLFISSNQLQALHVEGNWNENELFQFIYKHCPQIEKLRVDITPSIFTETLPNLKEFTVGVLSMDLIPFVERHGTLESLSAESDSRDLDPSLFYLAVAKGGENLTSISVRNTIEPLLFIQKAIYLKKSKPRSFKYVFKRMKDDPAWVKVAFKLPDDEALYNNRCTVWDDELINDISTFDTYGLNVFANQFK